MTEKVYMAIDLKSFYASVECRERGLDPLTTHLVVADKERTEKTICLAVSPSLKAQGVGGRPRLFEVVQQVKRINRARRDSAPAEGFSGSSYDDTALRQNPSLELDYIVAPPRMAFYVDYSARIYDVYLKYFSQDDIVVYSIDEVFIDITPYLSTYGLSAHDLARRVLLDVLETTGITATCGIGTNMYLAKVAMDIKAKHIPADSDGVRIASLDEMSYRKELWSHTPITDFWRVGAGYARKLAAYGMYTMGDVALCSVGKSPTASGEELLYRLFGVNAELLIDHAWGWEPCTIADIKAYKPRSQSLGSGQVLHRPYEAAEARIVVQEMIDALALDLIDKGLVCDQVVLTIGYDIDNLLNPNRRARYKGPVTTDPYGRQMPKHSHGTGNLDAPSASAYELSQCTLELFDRIVQDDLLIRRLNIALNHIQQEGSGSKQKAALKQLNLFDDYEALAAEDEQKQALLAREKLSQQAMLDIKRKFGKNAILKGMNLKEGATQKDRNEQIGGHRA